MQTQPCKSCPWRKSTKTEEIPGGGMDHVRAQQCKGEGFSGIVMACHLSTDEEPFVCVGFAIKVGWASIPFRFAYIKGLVRAPEEYESDEELHETLDNMLAAHPPRSAVLRELVNAASAPLEEP